MVVLFDDHEQKVTTIDEIAECRGRFQTCPASFEMQNRFGNIHTVERAGLEPAPTGYFIQKGFICHIEKSPVSKYFSPGQYLKFDNRCQNFFKYQILQHYTIPEPGFVKKYGKAFVKNS